MNDSFCVLPFYGIEYLANGQTTPCCLLPQTANIPRIQQEMLDGQRPTACQKCWTLEDQGRTSDRQLKNSAYDYYANIDIDLVKKSVVAGKTVPRIIKLYTSNVCNSTCVTCSATHSSAWATLTKQKTYQFIKPSIIDSLDYKEIVMLNFVGGEPLYERKNFEILEKLIAVNNTSCQIVITTNGSVQLTQHQKDILTQFKHIDMNLSIDGVGPVFEYLRYPLKWSDLLDNIGFYRRANMSISVSYTISNLNVLYYRETVDWFNNNQLPFNHNVVSFPLHFHPSVLPESVKLTYPDLASFFDRPVDACLYNKFLTEITHQDQLKGISINDYLPRLSKVLDEARNSAS